MDNQELIKKCRARLEVEDEPDSMNMVDMIEGLCDRLEKSDNNLKVALKALENVGATCSAIL